MRTTDPDTLMFFDAHPKALPLYQAFEELLFDTFSPVNKRVQKTQITFLTGMSLPVFPLPGSSGKPSCRRDSWSSPSGCRVRCSRNVSP